jgi:hypothetical protein
LGKTARGKISNTESSHPHCSSKPGRPALLAPKKAHPATIKPEASRLMASAAEAGKAGSNK